MNNSGSIRFNYFKQNLFNIKKITKYLKKTKIIFHIIKNIKFFFNSINNNCLNLAIIH